MPSAAARPNLLITPAQYKSEGLTVPTSVQRLFASLELQLFYSNQTGAVASTSAPSILDTSAVIGHSIDFDVHVVGDPAVGIKKVWVTYTYGEGQWQSLFLTLDSADQTHWSGRSPTRPSPPASPRQTSATSSKP